MNEWNIRIQQSFAHRGWDVWVIRYDQFSKKSYIINPIEMTISELPDIAVFPKPTLIVKAEHENGIWSNSLLKQACEQLIENGFGKREDVNRELGAVRSHLEDFKKLVFESRIK